jgi:iron(III) transport system ATP-binding protein
MPPWKRDVGMVFQSYALWPHMTVARNVAFGLEERRLPRAEVEKRVGAALALVGLSHLAERRPSQLSGGQQQRVALARTIAIEPKVLLLDEPLSNLDAKMRVEVRRELRELQQRLKLTTIFVTHDQEEANTVCDRIAVFNAGVIQQVGTPMHLYEKPANLFVANFLGTANILEGMVKGEGAERQFVVTGGGSIPVPEGTNVPEGAKLVFRPQYASIGTVEADAVPLSGTITHREFLGATVRYGVEIGKSTVLVDAPFHSGDALLAPGNSTVLGIKPSSALWLAH